MNDTNSINNPIVNLVEKSGLITLNLEELIPNNEILELDIAQFLHNDLILKEKEFNNHINTHNWSQYTNKMIAVYCSTNALLQQWAFMKIANKLQLVTNHIYQCKPENIIEFALLDIINNLPITQYKDQRVIIKGCSSGKLPDSAYFEISKKLLPVVKSLLFGEACSNVPIYKKVKQ